MNDLFQNLEIKGHIQGNIQFFIFAKLQIGKISNDFIEILR